MTKRIEKTVFISYRRTNFYTALAVYQYLTQHGYDAFFDFQSIDSGNFEKIITENIKAKAHFVVILSPSALERCKEPGDWLRREIEMAMDEKRNIVPLMMEGFDFGSPAIKKAMLGKLAMLNRYNGLRLERDYFFEAMNRLKDRFLNISLDDLAVHTLSYEAKQITESQKDFANEASQVKNTQLEAEELIERGIVFAENNLIGSAIQCFDQAIELDPNRSQPYYNRGIVYGRDRGNLMKAIDDFNKAILLDSDLTDAYLRRGNAWFEFGDFNKAKVDYQMFFDNGGSDNTARQNFDHIKRNFDH